MQAPNIRPERYAYAADFLRRLKLVRKKITFEQWQSLRRQALSGDVSGAQMGLLAILRGG